jgi:hypothetical protein
VRATTIIVAALAELLVLVHGLNILKRTTYPLVLNPKLECRDAFYFLSKAFEPFSESLFRGPAPANLAFILTNGRADSSICSKSLSATHLKLPWSCLTPIVPT